MSLQQLHGTLVAGWDTLSRATHGGKIEAEQLATKSPCRDDDTWDDWLVNPAAAQQRRVATHGKPRWAPPPPVGAAEGTSRSLRRAASKRHIASSSELALEPASDDLSVNEGSGM